MVSLAPTPAGPLAAADTLAVRVAGAESNVACYAAAYGVPTRWVSAVGDDPFGARVREAVAAHGVEVQGVRVDPDRPTGLMVKDPAPERTRVRYHRTGSAASAMGPEALDRAWPAEVLHLSGITPALSASCRELVECALRPDRPGLVSFDVNHRPALWPGRRPAELLRSLADRADLVFVGLDEAQALWGAGVRTAHDVRALLPSPRILVVKDGAREVTAFQGGEAVVVPALRVAVVEPVGAGDAFAAGFLSGRHQGLPLQQALRLGHLTAASALRVTGDLGPLVAEAERGRLLAADEGTWARAVLD
ncbi:sugar kinase [Streptomyces triticagri]|uniref:Sugar kinase n=1 Tax=Streptomyces triticagri TaxID=2293568 RepID=A0A372LVL5_9ACTN|nr:sugar kinase [Streptomyces triticagri]